MATVASIATAINTVIGSLGQSRNSSARQAAAQRSAVPVDGNGNGAHPFARRDLIAVRSSSGRGNFLVTIVDIARCKRCGGWILWGQTANGKLLPVEP